MGVFTVFTVLDDEHRMQLPDHRDCQGDYVNASYVDVSLSLIFNLNTSHSLSSIAGI